ncbi:cation transporter [Microbacterium sp. ARD31]|uniref:cation diffusion facilitator family transporter n=1 Tax=Microbacterium sp. ARD31 TaxID=2962576 RepID=UPI002882B2E5|nr:cation transporter [Microbacterium sp. ARD31]MDT0187914.1 cation transporter [Microbacterium sp. ARD31]
MTTSHVHAELSVDDRARLGRRAQLLAAASVTYNVVEAVIAITAGVIAGSVALVGFGLDSVVEVSSGLIILWQFRHRMPESRERQALRLMAFSFFALAAYVTFESVRALLGDHDPESSSVGIALAAASLAIMPFLSWAQRRTGKALGSNAVVADSTQTLLCTYLSAVLLVGLVLNATLGWSWADPIAGLIIAAVAVKEGRAAWRGEGCCGPIGAGHHDDASCGCADGACTDGCCTPTGAGAVDVAGPQLLQIGTPPPARATTIEEDR